MKTKSPIKTDGNGHASWNHKEGDKYDITGSTRDGKRFTRKGYSIWNYARCVNLWRGTKWLVRDGKRYIISKHYN